MGTREKSGRQLLREERQRERRKLQSELLAKLDDLVAAKGVIYNAPRVKALNSGRSIEHLISDVVHCVRNSSFAPESPICRQALRDAPGFSLVAVEGESGLIAYANRTSEVLFDWLGSSSLVGHHFRYCLHRPDWDSFRLFQQNVMASRARGEDCIGRSVTVRFLGRPKAHEFCMSPTAGREWRSLPKWALVASPPVELTLAGIQSRTKTGPEDSEQLLVLVANWKSDWILADAGIHVAHVRNMLSAGIFNQNFEVNFDKDGVDPIYLHDAKALPKEGSLLDHILSTLRVRSKKTASWIFSHTSAHKGAFEFSFDAPTDELRMKQVASLELLFGQKFEFAKHITMGQHNDAVPARRRERAFVIVDPSDRLETSLSCVHIHDYDVHAPSQAILLQRHFTATTLEIIGEPAWSTGRTNERFHATGSVSSSSITQDPVDALSGKFQHLFNITVGKSIVNKIKVHREPGQVFVHYAD